ncbi:hypothetical protein [Blastopirellula marina]|uniref:Uncharacterized protein n=1 Tax=Blastopirellula marina DSM 3645 TaxID=314230 RepID=A3ZR68_9BACT|nr:hypothetical protein [Blastopirellula marina]EAQ81164.1 hypothetical protein DSM3645_21372 [Blastopirellula marina DSM 3645]
MKCPKSLVLMLCCLMITALILPQPLLARWGGGGFKPNLKPNLKLDPKPNLKLDPKPNLKLDPKPNPKLDPKPNLKLDPKPNLKLDPKPNLKLDPKLNLKLDPKLNLKLDPKLNLKLNLKLDPKPNLKLEEVLPNGHHLSESIIDSGPNVDISDFQFKHSKKMQAELSALIADQIPPVGKSVPFQTPGQSISPINGSWKDIAPQELLNAIDEGSLKIDASELNPENWDLSRLDPSIPLSSVDPTIIALAIDPSGTLVLALEHQRRREAKEAQAALQKYEREIDDAIVALETQEKELLAEVMSVLDGARQSDVSSESPLFDFWRNVNQFDKDLQSAIHEIERSVNKAAEEYERNLRTQFTAERERQIADFLVQEDEAISQLNTHFRGLNRENWKKALAELEQIFQTQSQLIHDSQHSEHEKRESFSYLESKVKTRRAQLNAKFQRQEESPSPTWQEARQQVASQSAEYRDKFDTLLENEFVAKLAKYHAKLVAEESRLTTDTTQAFHLELSEYANESARGLKLAIADTMAELTKCKAQINDQQSELKNANDWRNRIQPKLPKLLFASPVFNYPSTREVGELQDAIQRFNLGKIAIEQPIFFRSF